MELTTATPSETLEDALRRLNYFQSLSKELKQGNEIYWPVHRTIDHYVSFLTNCHGVDPVLNPRTNTWEV